MKKEFIIFFTFACMLLISTVQTDESNSRPDYGDNICLSEDLSKIYVTPDQVLITPEGIFVYTINRDKLLKGELMAVDNGKVYVAVSNAEITRKIPNLRGPCRIHRVYHQACGGCGVLLCPGNCTCFD